MNHTIVAADSPLPAASTEDAISRDGAALLRVSQVGITHEGEHTATPASVTFEVAPGDVVLLLGPSGSGKSTLSLALNGLIPHAVPATVNGSIDVAGLDSQTHPVAALSPHVSMVFQDPDAQLVTGTLLDEVAFGPENLRLPVREVLQRAESALRQVGLWERRSENPDRLSGGGRQRLAIACALAMGSPLLVLDEPTANLDPQGIDDVYLALADIAASGEHGVVLIEHNLDAAIGFVTRVVVLDADGVVVADGDAHRILREQAAQLHDMGVWLPTATLAALRLARAGYRFDPLPLTPAELHSALEAAPAEPRAIGQDAGNLGTTPLASADSPIAGAEPVALQPRIRVSNLTVRRHKTEVLTDVSLEVHDGEFLAIVGANGAGKTTLLQAIAGVVQPPKRSVHVDGIDIARADDRTLSRHVGFVFQNPEHQFITASVFDEIAHGLRRQKCDEATVEARTHELLERFGLTERAHVHPFLLSGGQKRRLSVGTALVTGARILALDEPTFGQDRARADELLGLLRDLNREGTTIVIVTHDMQLVAEYADRLVVMSQGQITTTGTPRDVFSDAALLARTGLRVPPLVQALRNAHSHPELTRVSRLADLPGGAR